MRDGREEFEACLKDTLSGRSVIGKVYTKLITWALSTFK